MLPELDDRTAERIGFTAVTLMGLCIALAVLFALGLIIFTLVRDHGLGTVLAGLLVIATFVRGAWALSDKMVENPNDR